MKNWRTVKEEEEKEQEAEQSEEEQEAEQMKESFETPLSEVHKIEL